MSGTFDERGTESESTGKRPAPTIEGTATEVSVETDSDKTKSKAAEEQAAASDEPAAALGAPGSAEDSGAEDSGAEDSGAEDSGAEDSGAEDSAADDSQADEAASKPDEGDGDDAVSAPEPQRSPTEEPTERSFGGRVLAFIAALFTHALAGLAGGLAVLAALVLGYLPINVPQEQRGLDSIEARIATLEAAPKTPDNAAALEALKSRLATLESAAGDPEAPTVNPAEVNALAAQVAQMEASLKSLADAAKDGSSVADAAAISQQVAEAEQRLDSQLTSKIQSEIKTALASGEGGAIDNQSVQALKSEVSDLNARLKALTEATMEGGDTSKLEPEVSAMQRRLNEIESTLPSLVDAIDAENAQTRKANLVIAFAGLRDAVNSGRPYATELATMSALSSDSEDLDGLVEYEDAGIPTVPMLATSFAALRDKALAAQGDSDPDLLGRLIGSAQSLVKVRRVGEEAEGNSAGAILARAGAKLEAGKLHEAILEVESLDGPQAVLFGSWIDEALARLDAKAALQQLQEDLLVSLVGTDEGPHPAKPTAPREETD
ncbi:MAG: mitofilin family membrane protein [Methyloceanibacter sp.]|nr:mitofilin family membrane protein [Methyloceanibacter sp.]